MKMTYAGTGVDYGAMDPFKRLAQFAGRETAGNITRLNGGQFRELELSRGESAYLIETRDGFIAHVEEGLGTKNLVADAMYALTGKSYYDQVAQCTVAMIANDLATVGALPISLAMHLAAGASSWFEDELRTNDLVAGWKKACDLAGCVWGGGETPTLIGIVNPDTVLLSGSSVGIIQPKCRRIAGNIQEGDAIVLIESSGIHANGLTLARKIADKLPEGYLTKLPDGRSYGETLLDPTLIYVKLIERCLDEGVEIHYTINVTGHGWRKLMRSEQSWTYVIEQLPDEQPIFTFMQEQGPIVDREAYGNLNMGVGFALYVPDPAVGKVLSIAYELGFTGLLGGHIERGDKKVVIKPKGLEYLGDTLAVR